MKIPRKAPDLEIRTERERVINSLAPWTIINTRIAAEHFNTQDRGTLTRVYCMMLAHADRNTRIVRIGQQRIATALGIHRHTVGSNLRKLEDRGLIRRLARMPPPASVIIWRCIDNPDSPQHQGHMQARKRAARARPGP